MIPKYVRDINEVRGLSREEKDGLFEVVRRHTFYSNEYYLGLIDWNDPEDPIRRIIIPTREEIENGGSLDPSNEKSFTMARGLEHKYGPTALMLVSRACGGVCRFCFRKRLFMPDNKDAVPDLTLAFDYIREHEEINNILLSGGDPLVLPTKYLENILEELDGIPHVRFIRIGTKMVVYNPFRILEDPSLIDMTRRFSKQRRKLYIITDINHPRELTKYAVRAINTLQDAGAIFSNQTPLLRGVNDNKETLKELFNKLAAIGVPPYYVFQCRPTSGNGPFMVPIEEGYKIFESAKAEVSGLAKRSRFIISHATGKIEIAALTDEHIIFKYHNA
ncbi:MAG: KamA family radical SAM protein, partial [Candidatus Thermoplasmatota archaeon]|nr:KamA family radical SAM protein [Candidatus Thermoplasmatota archaeon]